MGHLLCPVTLYSTRGLARFFGQCVPHGAGRTCSGHDKRISLHSEEVICSTRTVS